MKFLVFALGLNNSTVLSQNYVYIRIVCSNPSTPKKHIELPVLYKFTVFKKILVSNVIVSLVPRKGLIVRIRTIFR